MSIEEEEGGKKKKKKSKAIPRNIIVFMFLVLFSVRGRVNSRA
jgi:hypothetical protein